MPCCASCAQNLPCEVGCISVAGFFSCEVDRETFYAQKARMFPGEYQRWLIVLERPSVINESTVKKAVSYWMQTVAAKSGLKMLAPGNVRDVRVLSAGVQQPSNLSEAVKVVTPVPTFRTGPLSSDVKPMLYVAIEFFYDGAAKSIAWPWSARGFINDCPEDIIAGLLAVMPSRDPARAPPDLGEQILIDIADTAGPAIDALSELAPIKEVKNAAKFLLWGGAAVVLFQIYKGSRRVRRTLT